MKTVTLSDDEVRLALQTFSHAIGEVYQDATAEEYEDAALESEKMSRADRKMAALTELAEKFA